MHRRIYDCVLYDGELEALLIRLHELQDVVDVFVVVESTHTPDGRAKDLQLRKRWSGVKAFAPDLRYIVVDDTPADATPPDRDRHRRDSIVRGLADAQPADLICLSDAESIPSARALGRLRARRPTVARLQLTPHLFFLNCRATTEPAPDLSWNCAFPYSALVARTPSELWAGIRDGGIGARTVANAGWHFTQLGARSGPRRPADRGWTITDRTDLPRHVRADPAAFQDLLLRPKGTPRIRLRRRFRKRNPSVGSPPAPTPADRRPVVICPYLYDKDKQLVIEAFGLDQAPGAAPPFYFWQDEQRIGPERAFEHCWSQFPDRDVIIVHTDMRPLPHQSGLEWYRDLLSAVHDLPGAAIVACDLLYPDRVPGGAWTVQSAGGYFLGGKFGYIGGRGGSDADSTGIVYGDQFAQPRPTEWVTFGGVYLRRETLDMVGSFDNRYEWAYIMDVDYCIEARVRGLTMVQVPVNLLHLESGTTREFLEQEFYRGKVDANVTKFYDKWSWFLDPHRPEHPPS